MVKSICVNLNEVPLETINIYCQSCCPDIGLQALICTVAVAQAGVVCVMGNQHKEGTNSRGKHLYW